MRQSGAGDGEGTATSGRGRAQHGGRGAAIAQVRRLPGKGEQAHELPGYRGGDCYKRMDGAGGGDAGGDHKRMELAARPVWRQNVFPNDERARGEGVDAARMSAACPRRRKPGPNLGRKWVRMDKKTDGRPFAPARWAAISVRADAFGPKRTEKCVLR